MEELKILAHTKRETACRPGGCACHPAPIVLSPVETKLKMLYPFLTDEDVKYWRARVDTGDPHPTLSLMHVLGRTKARV